MLETNTWKVGHKLEDGSPYDYQMLRELSGRVVNLGPKLYGELIGVDRNQVSLLCRAREGRGSVPHSPPAFTLQGKAEWGGHTHKRGTELNNQM